MIKNVIKSLLFKSIPAPSREKVRQDVERRNDEAARFIAARYTRGNVAIQRGDMLFEDDLGPRGAPRPR